jgi:uncharacterized membrane protein YbjE (DUF340 family)
MGRFMGNIIIFLITGIIVGSTFNLSEKLRRYNGKLQYIGVMILLFAMGASLGLNKSLLSNLKDIGLKSLLFAVLTSIFSIIMVYAVTKFKLKGEKRA